MSKILVIDDNKEFLSLVTTMIQSGFPGSTVLVADNGPDGITLATENKPDLILLDIVLNSISGIEVCETLKSQDETKKIPIMLLTGFPDGDARLRGLRAGAIAFLEKPVDYDILVAQINSVLKFKNYSSKNGNLQILKQMTKTLCERDVAIRKAKKEWEITFDAVPDLIIITDVDRKIIRVNKAFSDFIELPFEEIEGKKCNEVMHSDGKIPDWCPLEEVIADGGVHSVEVFEPRFNKWFMQTDSPLFDEKGVIFGIVHIDRDITHLKCIEENLVSIQDVISLSPVGIIMLNKNFEIIWINPAIGTYFGIDISSILGKNKKELISSTIQYIFEKPAEFSSRIFAAYENNSYVEQFECHILKGEGRQERWIEHWSQPITSGKYTGGRIENYLDITKYKVKE